MGINDYEEELLHDIRYYGRGKGHIKESEIWSMAYPMFTVATKEFRNKWWYPTLNALQSQYIFESIKRIVELDKIRVISEPELTWREKEFEYSDRTTRQDMTVAAKIKKGVIKIESHRILYHEETLTFPFCEVDLSLLVNLYGLDDGIIKNRCEGNFESMYFKDGFISMYLMAEQVAYTELSSLREIYKWVTKTDGELVNLI